MGDAPKVCWVDGRLAPLDEPAVFADDSAFSEGRGCYTSARVTAGRPRFPDRHAARLVRASAELGLGDLDPELVHRALAELAEAAFGTGDGVVRLQASRDGAGRLHVVGVPRPLGHEPAEWTAIVVSLPHEGGGLAAGLKVSSRLTMALAGDAAREAGVDEALLLDGGGQLVEGSRCNVFVGDATGRLLTPPLAAGAVAGIARGLVIERVPGVEERPIPLAALRDAREIVAANAVRGAAPIVRLDGAAVGSGRPGPWAERLGEALARD
ncbi:MAG: aminotransferase class IV [Myxococcota bacterium]|nr:aminotransferase class IV [Myxococcota bacterium]